MFGIAGNPAGRRRTNFNRMKIETATEDIIPEWEHLACEVESLFEGRMAGEKEFSAFMVRKIAQQEAFVVRDRNHGGELLGLIAVSYKNSAISWFAVSEEYRGRGIGSELLAHALKNMDKTRDISVVTFREDDERGLPARRLYRKFGFKDFDKYLIHDGLPRCLMKRPSEIK